MNENKIELNKSKFYEYFQDLTDIWVFNNKKREERNQFKSKLQTFIIKSKVYLKKKDIFRKEPYVYYYSVVKTKPSISSIKIKKKKENNYLVGVFMNKNLSNNTNDLMIFSRQKRFI